MHTPALAMPSKPKSFASSFIVYCFNSSPHILSYLLNRAVQNCSSVTTSNSSDIYLLVHQNFKLASYMCFPICLLPSKCLTPLYCTMYIQEVPSLVQKCHGIRDFNLGVDRCATVLVGVFTAHSLRRL